MSDLRFEFEWQDPAGAKGDELRATWASLSIFIGGHPVTEVHDRQSKSVRTSVFLPLFPLAEWIAENWWFLQSEVEGIRGKSGRAFDRRHNLRWAREGYALPSLRLALVGENVEARWESFEVPQAGIRFTGDGQANLSTTGFVEALRDFVNAVVARLEEFGLQETTLHEEWSATQNADADEEGFCRAAARLGEDPYSVDEALADAILDVSKRVRPELLNDFLSLASVHDLTSQATSLQAACESIASDAAGVDALKHIRSQAPKLETHANPWDVGYRFAEQLRAKFNSGAWKSRSLDELAGRLAIDRLEDCLASETGACDFLDALSGFNRLDNPKFLIKKRRQASRQFAFCRALFEHLTSPAGRFAAVSALRTERQQMNRAFAAEFLAPHKMLRADLAGCNAGEDEIDDLAADYGVSAFVVEHQIRNHNLADVSPCLRQ